MGQESCGARRDFQRRAGRFLKEQKPQDPRMVSLGTPSGHYAGNGYFRRFACEKAERASQQDTPLTEGRFYAQFYKIGDYGLGSSPFGQTAS